MKYLIRTIVGHDFEITADSYVPADREVTFYMGDEIVATLNRQHFVAIIDADTTQEQGVLQ